ncbi:MAG TPA: hypothetical protein DCM87_17855 [Planctomycetes bacterium]|nr:hypothetical protein [Planctomycetota bacterium]
MHHAESTRGLRGRLRVVVPAALALVLIGAAPPPHRVPRAPGPAAPVAPAAPEETDEAMLARFAAAVTTGEVRGLGNFIVPEEADDEELLGAFVAALRAVCGSPGAFRLVSFARIAPDRIFACYFAGRSGVSENRGPFMLVFEKLDTRWKTSLLAQIKAMGMKDADVAAQIRRAFACRVMGLRFGRLTLSQYAALLDASADACAALAEPPYGLPFGPDAVERMRKQAQQVLTFAGRPWADIEKTLIAEAGEDRLPELGDSYLGLYIEAGEGTREWRIPYAGNEDGFAAERLPFLTGEDVLRARADADVEPGERGVGITLSAQGTAMLTNVTLGCSGRRFAIVLDGKVISTAPITTPITNGEVAIGGGFSAEEASAIAARLNAYRARAMARCKEIEGAHAGASP